ncbi:MAG: hypothetical protein KC590_10140 [Nitrospira sp.]|nr:hypothetical protein [Nitrospira sp.]
MDRLSLDDIELAALLPGAQLVTGQGNVEETWISEIYAESGPTVAYVKVLNQNQLASEVVCALIGMALNLNIPKPYLVLAEKQNLPGSKKWLDGQNQKICFGSENAKSPSFRQLLTLNPNRKKAIWNILLKWDGFKETAWFDEWIANDDRNVGNVLWDGKKFWLIDHSHSLTGPDWVPNDLLNGKKVLNRFLGESFINNMDQTTKEDWKNLAGAEASRYQVVELATLESCGMMKEYATDEQISAVIKFLKTRADNFFSLACERLQLPQQLL